MNYDHDIARIVQLSGIKKDPVKINSQTQSLIDKKVLDLTGCTDVGVLAEIVQFMFQFILSSRVVSDEDFQKLSDDAKSFFKDV